MENITAKRLKTALSLRGMKQSDLVEKTHIGKSAISQYLSGKVVPKQDKIYLMAKALDVNEAWLMGYDVEMNRHSSFTVPYSPLPELTPKDERQIAKDLENMIHSLDGAAAMGEPEDAEDMAMIKASLETAMRLSKRIAKKKFTPKKYREE